MRRACVIALLPLLLASARADDKPDLQKIIDAWKAREKAIESLDVRWWSKRFECGRGNLGAFVAAAVQHNAVPPVPDNTYIIQYRFLADDKNRCRFEENGQEWSPDKSAFVPRINIELFDGKTPKTFSAGGAAGFPFASIGGKSSMDVGATVWLYPLSMVFRPISKLDSVFGVIDVKQLKLNYEFAAAKQSLIALTNGQRRVYVDPIKDYVPVRYLDGQENEKNWRADISYVFDDHTQQWLSHSWTIELRDEKNNILMSESATVLGFRINEMIPDSEFDLDLSRGALVSDLTNKSEYILRQRYEEVLKREPDSK